MVNKPDELRRLGLVALGATRRWDVAVDESLDGIGWSLELDGPQAYLVFQLQDLSVIPAALTYLQSAPTGDDGLVLGRFGSAAVSLIWDNEAPPRCFLIVGPDEHATLRLSFDGEDIRMLLEAFSQIASELTNSTHDNANGPPRR
jgi:hypothetical protein